MDWFNLLNLASQLILIPLGGYFVQKWFSTKKKKDRALAIYELANEGFRLVEALEKSGKIGKGAAKWTHFVEYVTSGMMAQGMKQPNAKEMDYLKKFIEGLSAVQKSGK